MVGTRHYLRLAAHVRAAGGKIVLVGDTAQLAEVDAGGIFAALIRRCEPLSLTGNQRQTASWERNALVALRDGNTDEALTEYIAHDRVHAHVTPSRTRRQLAADYLGHRERHADPYAVVALASTRCDVDRLNTAIRHELRSAGRLGPDAIVVSGEDADCGYATGDLVVVTRNDHRVGLLNGTRATIARADLSQLTLHTEAGDVVTVPSDWASGYLDHGYALTVHKAQGLTTDVALLYGAAALCQQAAYVALSRGRDANHLYTTLVDLQPANSGFTIDTATEFVGPNPTEVLRSLADHLRHDRRQTLASDQRPVQHEPLGMPSYRLPERSAARKGGRSR
jgi:ATP-dependent exoDNAse (exonuclease V) alpha subunit